MLQQNSLFPPDAPQPAIPTTPANPKRIIDALYKIRRAAEKNPAQSQFIPEINRLIDSPDQPFGAYLMGKINVTFQPSTSILVI